MGFSHYWDRPKELDKKIFKLLVEDVRKIIKQVEKDGLKIRGRAGNGEPTITDELIEFNGDSDTGLDAENFYIKRVKDKDDKRDKGSCKTGLMPYDTVVGAVLVCLRYRFGDIVRINSDEGIKLSKNELAKDGILLAEKVLGVKLIGAEGFLQDSKIGN